MKSNLFLPIIAVVALFSGSTANAQLKAAVLDMQDCLNQYYKTSIEVEKINAMAKEKRTSLDERTADLKSLENKMIGLDKIYRDTSLSDAKRQEAATQAQKIAQERQAKLKEISDAQRKYQAEILQARQRMEVSLVDEIRGILATLATEQGFDLVHDKSFLPKANKALVFVGPNVPNLTTALIEKLNANAPAGAVVAPAAGTGEATPQ